MFGHARRSRVHQPGRQRLHGRSGPRLRLPPRRRDRHRFRFVSAIVFARIPVVGPGRIPTAFRTAPPATRCGARSSVHARLPDEPGADRRPADHARRGHAGVGRARINLLLQRAAAGDATWSPRALDDNHDQRVSCTSIRCSHPTRPATAADLRRGAACSRGGITTLTYTCVPPGSGARIGIDRDLDGISTATNSDSRRIGGRPRGAFTRSPRGLPAAR